MLLAAFTFRPQRWSRGTLPDPRMTALETVTWPRPLTRFFSLPFARRLPRQFLIVDAINEPSRRVEIAIHSVNSAVSKRHFVIVADKSGFAPPFALPTPWAGDRDYASGDIAAADKLRFSTLTHNFDFARRPKCPQHHC